MLKDVRAAARRWEDRIARNFVRKIAGAGYSLPDHLPQRDKTRIRLGNEALHRQKLLRRRSVAVGRIGQTGTNKGPVSSPLDDQCLFLQWDRTDSNRHQPG